MQALEVQPLISNFPISNFLSRVKGARPACGAQGGAILRFALTMESQWKALRHHSLAFSWASAERSPPLLEIHLNLTRMPCRVGIKAGRGDGLQVRKSLFREPQGAEHPQIPAGPRP